MEFAAAEIEDRNPENMATTGVSPVEDGIGIGAVDVGTPYIVPDEADMGGVLGRSDLIDDIELRLLLVTPFLIRSLSPAAG